jgi:cytochrome bd-type quinol oxidase subunit 2
MNSAIDVHRLLLKRDEPYGNAARFWARIFASGHFFLPLWTHLSPRGEVVLKTEGSVPERTRLFGARCWVGFVAINPPVSCVSFSIQPNLIKQFRSHRWGLIFRTIAVMGMIGMRLLGSRRQDLQAFWASGLHLVGMLTSVAFGIVPNALPSNTAPDLSLTIHNSATAQHGLIAGLCWFIPGIALAIAYSVFVDRHFAGRVA